MKKQHLYKVLYVSGVALSLIFFIILIIDLALAFSIIIFLYEFIIGNILIIWNCSFNLLRYSIPYLFIFFILSLFNIRYIGYIKLKFFGIDLQQQNSKVAYLAFFFKEYNYWILFVVNFLFIMLFLYNIMYKNFLICGLILSFYIFIGLSVYIKSLLIKHNYYNKKTLNMCLNFILGATIGLYLMEAGDTLEQYLGFKINFGEFLYGFFKQNDKFLLKLRHDNMWNHYKWWHLNDLYKNQKASCNYLYLKNKIIDQKLLTDVAHNNKNEYNDIKNIINNVNVKNNYQIQQNNINDINFKNNEISTDKNMVYYTNAKFDNQVDLLKKLNYSYFLENQKLKLYLLNMKGFSAGDLVPNGKRNNFNLLFLLDKDKNSVINYLNKIVLDQQTAKNFNSYLYVQNKINNQQHFFNILLNKNKSLFFLKITKTSVLNLIKEPNLDFNLKNFSFDKLQKYITNIFNNNFIYEKLYSYNHFLNWWEKQNYIINNFFKGYNVKKYAPLTKYNFEGKNTLFNLFQKDATNNILKPIKIGEIQEVQLNLKLSNCIDRNLLYCKYSKTFFHNKIGLLSKISIQNNDMVKIVYKKLMFIVNQNIIYKPTCVETFLHYLVNWSKSTTLKSIYLKYYPTQIPEYYNFWLKKSYSSLVIYSENYNNQYYATLKYQIKTLNGIEYQKYYKSFSIYSYFFNKSMNFDFNNKINNLEGTINNTKKIYSIFFKDNNTNNYNNQRLFLLFKSNYVWQLNDYLDISTYKNYIIKIASNLDTNDNTANLYFKQFLFKTADILAFYFSWNKMSFGQLIDYLKQWQLFFNKYANIESSNLKRQADYNFFFKTLKNPHLDRSVYLKEYFKAIKAYNIEIENNAEELENENNAEELENENNAEELESEYNNNIKKICHLAYDTRTAMLHEDLDKFIDEKESILLLKGEVKSCNKAAAYLTTDLQELYKTQNKCLSLIAEKYKLAWKNVKMDVIESYKEIEDIEQVRRVFSNFSQAEIDAFVEEDKDRESIEYALNFDEEKAELIKQDINRQYELCCKYIMKLKLQEQRIILDNYCYSIEELLENIIKMRDADQENLTYSIENKLNSLKEFSLQRNIWLKEQSMLQLEKSMLQLKKETELLTQKKWDLYNYKRFKNEIINFKKKK